MHLHAAQFHRLCSYAVAGIGLENLVATEQEGTSRASCAGFVASNICINAHTAVHVLPRHFYVCIACPENELVAGVLIMFAHPVAGSSLPFAFFEAMQ